MPASSDQHRSNGDSLESPLSTAAPGTTKLELLSAMDILSDLPDDVIAGLMAKSPMRTTKKGAMIYGAEGPEVLFMLKSGQVELYRQSSDGRRLTIRIVEEGTFFGEMSLIDVHLAGTYAVAREDCVICILSRHDVESLITDHPAVALRLITVLTQRLQESRNSLHDMTFNTLTSRVARLLLRLADDDENAVVGYSHQDLASMVGCVRESFTSVLDHLKSTGAVDTGRRRIAILDRGQLEWVVDRG